MLIFLSKHFSAPSSSVNTSNHPRGFRQTAPGANFTTGEKPPPETPSTTPCGSSPPLFLGKVPADFLLSPVYANTAREKTELLKKG